MIANKKIKKLIKNPGLFFRDLYLKRKNEIRNPFKRVVCNHTYSVVSAVYNSDKYLTDFFKSFVKQTVSFKDNIQLILVDDGSVDNSKAIIQEWVAKYPDNITYIYKENGGQASARNLGLKNVNTEWVTFIDSDDFVSRDYFELVDAAISKNKKIKLICCNQIYYFEESKTYIDRHPLNYRFSNEKTILPSGNLGKFMQFSAPLSFFHVKSIPQDLLFDEQLKPTFEDGKFVNLYLLSLKNAEVCFYAKPKYFNRKREDKSSTMDNAWLNKGQYGVVLKEGYIVVLKSYLEKLGHIPLSMQRTILWELLRLVKHLVNQEENVSFLSYEEKNTFLELMDETFSYIDADTILNFELGACGFSRQVGMLGCFKKTRPSKQIIYIDKYDASSKSLLVRYFTTIDSYDEFYLDGKKIYPTHVKYADRKFLSRTFVTEKRMWLPITDGEFVAKIDDELVNFNYFGKREKDKVKIKFEHKDINPLWLFMDRDDCAGDNAEFLYEYAINQSKENCFFVLNKQSQDWPRLKLKNFKLVEYGSEEHAKLMRKATLLISSHVGGITNPFKNETFKCKYVFLQHGVTKDDISKWINNCSIDLMFTASAREHESIVKDHGKYIYGNKEIVLTGFPRFDSLLKNDIECKRQILIMPTWRKEIAGVLVNNQGSARVKNEDFEQTSYAQSLNSLINSPRLAALSKKYNFDIVFCPHPNMRPYVDTFSNEQKVRIALPEESIHSLIKESIMLITDYSSVAFDFAYMKKSLCYYQFDEAEFFSGSHTYSKGDFDYRENGFGPVINEIDELLDFVENQAANNFIIDSSYMDKITKEFKYVDSGNARRVYNEIISLEESKTYPVNINMLKDNAFKSLESKNWNVAAKRFLDLIQIGNIFDADDVYLSRVQALREMGCIGQSYTEFYEYFSPGNLTCAQKNELSAILACHFRWKESLELMPVVDFKNESTFLSICLALFNTNDIDSINTVLAENADELDYESVVTLRALVAGLTRDYQFVQNVLPEKLLAFRPERVIELGIELIFAEIYTEIDLLSSAQSELEKYELHSKNNSISRHCIIKLANKNHQFEKVISEFECITDQAGNIDIETVKYYVHALRKTFNNIKALTVIESAALNYKFDSAILFEKGMNHLALTQWTEAESALKNIMHLNDAVFGCALALRMQGKLEEAYNVLNQSETISPDSFEQWKLLAEICQLNNRWNEAANCWSQIFIKYPRDAEDKHWSDYYNTHLLSLANNDVAIPGLSTGLNK